MTWFIVFVLFVLVLRTLILVMYYGRGVIFPNFEEVDRRFGSTGRPSWNSLFGKIFYYLVLTFFAGLVYFVVSSI